MHKSNSCVLFIIYFIPISLLSGNKYTSQGYNGKCTRGNDAQKRESYSKTIIIMYGRKRELY